MKKTMKVYSGSSNQLLARLLAQKLNIALGKVELARFHNNECRVFVADRPATTVILVQSFSEPVDEHIIEFCLMADALHRTGAESIIAVIPWLGYSKQDKIFRPGEALSVKVIANILQTTPIKRFITLDLHNPAIAGFFDTPLFNISCNPIFRDYFKEKDLKGTVVVSPDTGAMKASSEFANAFKLPIAHLNKQRDLRTGRVEVIDIDREVEGKQALILDDMIVTGATLIKAAAFLKKRGVISVTVAATHHLYLLGVQEKLTKAVEAVVVTDSIMKPAGMVSGKLTILSVADLIAQAI
ncbi:hypothetical protein A3A66_01440 [Microgenomates group bacterium RIFCSPLOWO2_01_FULL_46_13]|nr:MAG: hypothetical protein A3A66_01440 [Microgenomates group bacterium RIFCSPLOWO2_01_FULL_46_13]